MTTRSGGAPPPFAHETCALPLTPGSLQFTLDVIDASESQGTASITVNRTGGSDGAVSVNFATSDGSATAGSDYTATSGTPGYPSGKYDKGTNAGQFLS